MTVTSSTVAREIRQTLDAFFEFGIAAFTNPVSESGTRVTWHSYGTAEDFLLSRDDLTVKGYLHWLENGHYSALLVDGALLQISYDFDGAGISGHRLAYVPCPVDVSDPDSRDLIEEGWPWGEIVRAKLVNLDDVHMKTAIRFDFDPVNASLEHPESHLTMNTVDCRIACSTPMRLGRFLDFVFKTFYPGEYRKHSYLRSFTKAGWFDATIMEEQRAGLHVAWTL